MTCSTCSCAPASSARSHRYFMKASPVRPGDFIEFFAEIDLIGALSACPGGDCGETHSSDAARCHPLKVEIFRPSDEALRGLAPARGQRLFRRSEPRAPIRSAGAIAPALSSPRRRGRAAGRRCEAKRSASARPRRLRRPRARTPRRCPAKAWRSRSPCARTGARMRGFPASVAGGSKLNSGRMLRHIGSLVEVEWCQRRRGRLLGQFEPRGDGDRELVLSGLDRRRPGGGLGA